MGPEGVVVLVQSLSQLRLLPSAFALRNWLINNVGDRCLGGVYRAGEPRSRKEGSGLLGQSLNGETIEWMTELSLQTGVQETLGN